MLKKLLKKYGPNPLEQILKRAEKTHAKSFLIFWNRGLGDIALGLFAIVHRIREIIPDSTITFLTRSNLLDGFTLLGGVEVIALPHLKRGDKFDAAREQIDTKPYDIILENPDPTHWVSWQLGKLTPTLHWQEPWDALQKKFGLDPSVQYVGAHVQTETNYASWRDWPLDSWKILFEKITERGEKVLLFGFETNPLFDMEGVIDLRGKTELFELLSVIKNRCRALVVPDSGVSSMVYFLNESFPIKHISLWAEPYMGILKQNVASPNPLLEHCPILGKDKDIRNITPQEVYERLYTVR